MKCPYCGCLKNFVKETRSDEAASDEIVRKRMCTNCFNFFYTSEGIIQDAEGKRVIQSFRKSYNERRAEHNDILRMRQKERMREKQKLRN